ncbi:phosphate signaling complex protein PhoU [Brachybacterium sp. EF45031]|uniref:phosphate signaling complex protein PhoU n=1 Tax=Brachybacterium sillae TaxID=2810536 RepID=UPI00217E9638|nr:phosphate signaling complex protein PhoU [Brachybacterium sillae]MCS6712265.1 phosphate signaling complex protein PhoU [Brachybacterium sillae]
MREAFQNDLLHTRDDLLEMARLVADAVQDASTALLELDLGLAEKVIAADVHIDEIQAQLDEKIVELLARQAPVATDLRLLVSALRMSSTLERMGDLGEHIAMVARRSHPSLAFPEEFRSQLESIASLTVSSIRDAAAVIEGRDLALAAEVAKRDTEIDETMQGIYKAISREEVAVTAQQAMDLTLVARFYERLGDHAVSLVRRVGFLVTGDSLDPHSLVTDVPES